MQKALTALSFLFLLSISLYAQPIYVDADAIGNNDGSSWPNAFTDLQLGLATAQSGDTIWLAEGVYRPVADDNRFVSFEVPSGVAIYGGFNGMENALNERDWINNTTLLSGDIGLPGDSLDNSVRVVSLLGVEEVTLDGISIRYANNNFSSVIIKSRTAGAIFAEDAGFRLYNVSFQNNTARFGGAIGLFTESRMEAYNCTFEQNTSNGANDKCGGAVYAESDDDQAYYENCRFFANRVRFAGGSGGVGTGGTNTFVNCIFGQNEAAIGMAFSFMNATVFQSVFWRQQGNSGLLSDGQYSIHNSIIWANINNGLVIGGSATFESCLLQGVECPAGSTCDGNMLYGTPPHFVDPFAGDFRISLCSPAVDMGSNASVPAGLETDAGGLSRIIGGVVDMGAHEMLDLEPQFLPTEVRSLEGDYGNRTWLSALACANAITGPDTIRFRLGPGTHLIFPRYESECIAEDLVIDPTDDYTPGEVIIDGEQYAHTDLMITCALNSGVFVREGHFEMYGMEVRNFPGAGLVLGSNTEQAVIGKPGFPNHLYNNGAGEVIQRPNLTVSGQGHCIQSNYIGIPPSGAILIDDYNGGILIGVGASNVLVGGKQSLGQGNIFGNCFSAVALSFSNDGTLAAQDISVMGNHFGLDPVNGNTFPNRIAFGAAVNGGSFHKRIRFGGTADEGNVVAYCTADAIQVLGQGTEASFRRNTFICNFYGIDLDGFTPGNPGNNGITPPQITAADIFHLSGTAGAGDTVEVYLNEVADCPDTAACNQGRFFFGERIADANGQWEILEADFPFPLFGGEQVTAIRTNFIPVTSAFSPCVEVVCPESFAQFSALICPSDSLIINGTTYNIDHPSGTEVLVDASSIGCDSIVEVSLSFLPEPVGSFDTILCESESLQIGDSIFDFGHPSGTARLPGMASNGCDSLVNVSIDFKLNAEALLTRELCQGDTLFFNGDQLTEAGNYQYFFEAANGCDSLLTLELTVLENAIHSISAAICEGDTFLFQNQLLLEAGTYEAMLEASNGCDSLLILELIVNSNVQTELNATLCKGATYEFCGNIYTEAGEYDCLLSTSTGCDSTVHLVLEEGLLQVSDLDTTLCQGAILEINGEVFSTAGNYEIVLTGDDGCDSLLQLSLQYVDLPVPEVVIEPDLGFGDGSIEVQLADTSLAASWEDGSSSLLREQLFAGDYSLILTDSQGCVIELQYTVEEGTLFLAVPNVFTPNGDGDNDYFNVVSNASTFELLRFEVYNRWGQKVYDNNQPELGWDGTFNGVDQPAEAYFYRIEVESRQTGQESQSFQGSVSLIR
jgi:gliding motility-associated-like protein